MGQLGRIMGLDGAATVRVGAVVIYPACEYAGIVPPHSFGDQSVLSTVLFPIPPVSTRDAR